ncbi:hypothetical protein [Corynebacterium lactis]|uniref:Uncharacterized protein n=1 Tax=Corynebacterium lactis RW2-5 TaxID=1408189 RepID=A0A0K2H408_9CORY|nr:hypothetical protein [Corynebacterium lactis]ALA68456.1 hypothetical protein CLAC_03495 [Corynebacterium lactis RW2-5]
MTFKTFVMTDEWRVAQPGDVDDKETQMLRRGITGHAELTPVLPEGTRVDDDPRAWSLLSRTVRADYHLGRLVGPDGLDGVRLVGWVNGKPVAWKVKRQLRFNRETRIKLPDVVVAPVEDTAHLPDLAPMDPDDIKRLPEVRVAINDVINDIRVVKDGLAEARENVSKVEGLADRAEKAAATIPAFEDAVVKVTSASTVVEEATRRAEAAAGDSEMHAEEASASQVASESARDESRLARDTGTAARDEVTSLAVSIKADRSAAEEAARNAEATAKREAAAAVAALVDSAPEHLDTLAEIAQLLTKQGDAASALTQTVAGKAPLKHTHQVGDISGLQATLSGKAEASHQHSISQVEELQSTLDGIRDELAKRARGNFDFTVATKPPGPGTPATTVTVITKVLP